jgi:hypothetical protein
MPGIHFRTAIEAGDHLGHDASVASHSRARFDRCPSGGTATTIQTPAHIDVRVLAAGCCDGIGFATFTAGG